MCESYEEHNGACCSDCHDFVSCATSNLFCVPSSISTSNSGEKPVVYDTADSQVKGEEPYNGVCEVCHTSTSYHRNNASGNHTHYANSKCTGCHLHGPMIMVSDGLCYTCHGGSPGDVPAGNPPMFASPSAQAHQTHNNAAKGPQCGDVGDSPGCTGCHQSAAGGGIFSDGLPFTTTNACDNCHSDGGAFDGVAMAKANWNTGIYETDGTTLKSGKEQWCVTCHDAVPANSKQDGTGVSAPNKAGDNSSYGYYVTGHGTTGTYNATQHGQNGPGYGCTVCHDTAASHISGTLDDSDRLKTVTDDALDYTTDTSEVCLDCHKVGKSADGSLGYDATAEATVHSGGVAGNFNTSGKAPDAFPSYGDSADYATNPGYQCYDCHDVHGTQQLAMILSSIDGNLGGTSNPVSVAGFESTDTDLTDLDPSAAADNGVCDTCHASGDNPHPDGDYVGNHNQGNTGNACIVCHYHTASFTHAGGSGGSGCDECHGHDAGFEGLTGGGGTYKSHSTHTENDSDDYKGPNIDCFECHDTSNYPVFADAATTLAATTVCNNCHSPDGAYNGVTMAKASWASGVYEADGSALLSGKEQWCASCHDDDPAFSTSQLYEVIVDNPDATFVGAWTTGSNADQYGDSVQWNQITGPVDSTATWRPDIPYAGQYSVYAWWTVHSNRATDAPYTIYYDGGSETVDVNQEQNGGKWNFLGTYAFAEGTSGYVVLSDDSAQTGQYVIADAVKFLIGPQGMYAPKVIGDNSTYGYYATGHGENGLVECLDCHDASDTHIDHDARTYDAGVKDYCDSYRLKQIDGQPGMDVPRGSGGGLANWQDFALCFECHDRYQVIGANSTDVSQTNFWDDDASPNNSHWYHLGMGNVYDSDYDGTTDSAPSCTACHNVHGSPTGPMIRHGELISPYGTTSYVPSFNFYYLIGGDGSATATFTPTLAGGTYNVYAWWTAHTNRATNTKYVINYDGGSVEVTTNQEQNGDQWNLLGQYDFAAGTSGNVVLTSDGANEYIMADAVRWYRTDDGDEVIVDDADATYQGTWTSAAVGYNSTQHYYYAPIWDASASVSESVGGVMSSGGLSSNHSCGT
jgi:hypothetical protein